MESRLILGGDWRCQDLRSERGEDGDEGGEARWKGRTKILVQGEKPESPQQPPEGEGGGEQSVTEDAVEESTTKDSASEMSEVDPEEMETGQKTWLVEKVTTIEKENGELKKAFHEMETRLHIQESAMKHVDERCGRIETARARIAEKFNNTTPPSRAQNP